MLARDLGASGWAWGEWEGGGKEVARAVRSVGALCCCAVGCLVVVVVVVVVAGRKKKWVIKLITTSYKIHVAIPQKQCSTFGTLLARVDARVQALPLADVFHRIILHIRCFSQIQRVFPVGLRSSLVRYFLWLFTLREEALSLLRLTPRPEKTHPTARAPDRDERTEGGQGRGEDHLRGRHGVAAHALDPQRDRTQDHSLLGTRRELGLCHRGECAPFPTCSGRRRPALFLASSSSSSSSSSNV